MDLNCRWEGSPDPDKEASLSGARAQHPAAPCRRRLITALPCPHPVPGSGGGCRRLGGGLPGLGPLRLPSQWRGQAGSLCCAFLRKLCGCHLLFPRRTGDYSFLTDLVNRGGDNIWTH